jgi:hypothetical protein
LCLLAGAAAPARAAGIENADAAKALAYYERGEYQRAAAELEALVDAKGLTAEEKRRTREALGVTYYVLGRLLDARRQFTLLLHANPGYEPDALYVAPEIVAFVADVRRSLVAAAAPAAAPAAATTAAGAVTSAALTATAPQPPALRLAPEPAATAFSAVDLLPFGAGQYRRGNGARGAALTSLEGLFLGVNVGLYYYRRCELKRCSEHYYPAGKVVQAQHLQTIQIAAGSLFLFTAALGVADGIWLPVPGNPKLAVKPVGSGLGLAWETD